MDKKDYDIKLAAAAQLKFCEDHNVPMFAPSNGSCYRCCRNIYAPRELKSWNAVGIQPIQTAYTGVSVAAAGAGLITCCPHCGYSFVD